MIASGILSPRCFRAILSSLLPLSLLLLAACAGRDSGPAYTPIAQQEARVRWEKANRDRMISDVVFSHDGTDGAALVIGKHQTVLELFRRGETLRATGSMARPPWRGTVAATPQPLTDWAMLLEAWQAVNKVPGDGKQEIHTPDFRASFERTQGTLQTMMVRPSVSGSTFIVRFSN